MSYNEKHIYVLEDTISGCYVGELNDKHKEYVLSVEDMVATTMKHHADDLLEELKGWKMDCDRPEDYYEPELKVVDLCEQQNTTLKAEVERLEERNTKLSADSICDDAIKGNLRKQLAKAVKGLEVISLATDLKYVDGFRENKPTHSANIAKQILKDIKGGSDGE